MQTLLKLLHHHVIYKDVFREVGLIEVMVTCLQRYAALLKDSDFSCSASAGNDHHLTMLLVVIMTMMHWWNAGGNNSHCVNDCTVHCTGRMLVVITVTASMTARYIALVEC